MKLEYHNGKYFCVDENNPNHHVTIVSDSVRFSVITERTDAEGPFGPVLLDMNKTIMADVGDVDYLVYPRGDDILRISLVMDAIAEIFAYEWQRMPVSNISDIRVNKSSFEKWKGPFHFDDLKQYHTFFCSDENISISSFLREKLEQKLRTKLLQLKEKLYQHQNRKYTIDLNKFNGSVSVSCKLISDLKDKEEYEIHVIKFEQDQNDNCAKTFYLWLYDKAGSIRMQSDTKANISIDIINFDQFMSRCFRDAKSIPGLDAKKLMLDFIHSTIREQLKNMNFVIHIEYSDKIETWFC